MTHWNDDPLVLRTPGALGGAPERASIARAVPRRAVSRREPWFFGNGLCVSAAMRSRPVLVPLIATLLGAATFVQLRTRAAERAHRVRGRFLDVDGVRLHYVERGSGTPLVLVHGLGSMIDDFLLSGLLARAAERYRVIAI